MNLIDKILLNELSKKEINYYGWLSFLLYPYKGKMLIKTWKDDGRFKGITCLEAMQWLQSRNLVIITDKEFIAKNIQKGKEIIKEIFGEPKTFEELENRIDELKTFDNSDYHYNKFSNIPKDIFYDERNEAKFKKSNLTFEQYSMISNWLKKYQRQAHGWNNKLNKCLGKVGDLLRFDNYTLYRGIYLPDYKNESFKNIKEGDFLIQNKNNLSWTQAPSIRSGCNRGRICSRI